ncbi:MAG: hypothetical protein AAF402_06725 [Pseudomonadota bacterium]
MSKKISDTQIPSARRKAIKTLGIGGAGLAAPAAWQKPVIDTVLLPSHAQTTDSGGDGTGGTTTPEPFSGVFFGDVDGVLSTTSINGPGDVLTDKALIAQSESGPMSWLISDAHANATETHICITVTGDQFSAALQVPVVLHSGGGLEEQEIAKFIGEFEVFYVLEGTVGDALALMDLQCKVDGAVPSAFLEVRDTPAPSSAGVSVNVVLGKNSFSTVIPEDPCNFRFICETEVP